MHARTHTHTHTHTHNMYKTYTRAAGSTVQFISTNSPCLMKFNNKLKSKDNLFKVGGGQIIQIVSSHFYTYI